MIDSDFKVLSEALAELNWQDRQLALDVIQRNYEKRQYFVAFIGQYSAGKSRLINNLLGRNVLPTGVNETTPLLTYVRYGEKEKARLHYLDHAVREISLDEVGTVIQNSDHWEPDQLDYLEVFLSVELLRSGLILLDTPGINTVIHRHEQLLAMSLNLASRIIYVVGQAPHGTDIEMIKSFREQGMEMVFVRTHCEEIMPQEENPDDVIRADQALLGSCGIDADSCFHVSNLEDSNWFGNLRNLRTLLAQVGREINDEIERATALQLQKMGSDCIAALEEKASVLSAIKTGDEQARAQKLAESEKKIAHFEKVIADCQQKLRLELSDCEQKIRGKITQDAHDFLDDAVGHIANCCDEIQTPEQMLALMRAETQHIFEQITADINVVINPILHGIRDGLQLETFSFDSECIPAVESYTELTYSQNCQAEHLLTQLNYLRENRTDIEQQLQKISEDPAYSNLQEDLKALEQAIIESKNTYHSLPPYTPQFVQVDDGKMQPSQTAKMIGNIADWALLLLPGGAVSGAIKGAAESGKFVSKLATMIGKSEKALAIIKNGDTVKDIAFALQNMSKTYATQKRIAKAGKLINTVANGTEKALKVKQTLSNSGAPSTFLDYLTIQYWAEQIGKNFDTPPKLVVDKEYEQRYLAAKGSIEKKLLEHQQRAYRIRCEQQAFENEQERLTAERKASIVDERQIQAELDRVQNEIAAAAEKEAKSQWKKACGSWYREHVSSQIPRVLENYLSSFADRLYQYQEDRIQEIYHKLSEEQQTYQNLLGNTASSAEELTRVTALLDTLKGVVI